MDSELGVYDGTISFYQVRLELTKDDWSSRSPTLLIAFSNSDTLLSRYKQNIAFIICEITFATFANISWISMLGDLHVICWDRRITSEELRSDTNKQLPTIFELQTSNLTKTFHCPGPQAVSFL